MRRAADAVLLFITALWGITFVVVKGALGDADPMSFLALRFTLAAVVAVAIARRALKTPGLWKAAGVLGLCLVSGYALQTWGLVSTSPSRSAFLTGLCVIFVPFLSAALFRRALSPPAIAGAAIAVGGLYLLTGAGAAQGSLLGDGLTLGCAIAFAFHIALTERHATRFPPFALVAAQLVACAAVFTATVPLGPMKVTWTPGLWVAIGLTGVFATTLGIGLQTWAQARTTAVRAALVYALEPVFAVAYSTLITGDRVTGPELLGGGLIVLGVVVGEVGTALRRVPAEP